ncbi:RADIALIS-like protein 3 [Tanacetum coccineum]
MSKIQDMGSSLLIWTWSENKLFEIQLVEQDENDPNRWLNIAKVTGKTVEQVRSHYELLVEDIDQIESDMVPLPNYKDDTSDNYNALKSRL